MILILISHNPKVDMVHHTFHYDDSFPKPPTSSRIHSDYPWADLYPQHGPYFNKSATNPERWTFSVFHQLHCVVSTSKIRRYHEFWNSWETAANIIEFERTACDTGTGRLIQLQWKGNHWRMRIRTVWPLQSIYSIVSTIYDRAWCVMVIQPLSPMMWG